MAALPGGVADLDFLDWLAEEDVLNNEWDEDVNVDAEEHVAGDEAIAAEDAVAVEEVAAEDSDLDDGIVADASDDEEEMEIHSMYLSRVDPMNGLYCTTMAYVTVEVVGGVDYEICQGCFIAYRQMVGGGYYRHTDYHGTTKLADGERGYCKSCKDPLFQIRPVEICNICNNSKKK